MVFEAKCPVLEPFLFTVHSPGPYHPGPLHSHEPLTINELPPNPFSKPYQYGLHQNDKLSFIGFFRFIVYRR